MASVSSDLAELASTFNATKCLYKVQGYKAPKNLNPFRDCCTCKPVNGVVCGEDCEHRYQCMNCHADCHDYPCENQFIRNNSGGDGLVLYHTKKMGVGVKTTRKIREGEYVISYVGELIDEGLYKRRLKTTDCFYGVYVEPKIVMDNLLYGNISRFINHSCEPNLLLETWYLDMLPVPTLWAARDIGKGEELFFNYNTTEYSGPAFECQCGAPECKDRAPSNVKDISDFPCMLCDFPPFKTKGELNQHLRGPHGVTWTPINYDKLKSLKCKECDKVCRYKSKLLAHTETHLEVRTEKCHLCPKTFKTDKNLKEHLHLTHKLPVYNKNGSEPETP